MLKKLLIILLLLAAITAFFMFKKNQSQPPLSEVCFKDYCFEVELAKTMEEKTSGLMFRKELAQNRGMLFIYNQEGYYSIWMKNTLIPLDIIWLNQNREVVFLVKDAPPTQGDNFARFEPDKPARYILEINAGWIYKMNLKVGDRLSF